MTVRSILLYGMAQGDALLARGLTAQPAVDFDGLWWAGAAAFTEGALGQFFHLALFDQKRQQLARGIFLQPHPDGCFPQGGLAMALQVVAQFIKEALIES